MTWRTVMISSNSKLDLKLGYMVVRGTEIHKVHLSEISVLIIESTAVSMTAMLLCELTRRGIKVIFCDERRNPYGELEAYHNSYDSTGKLRSQIEWSDEVMGDVWERIIKEKIRKQASILLRFDYDRFRMLEGFANDVKRGDVSNREGHAAKVYFNTVFGDDFSRRDDSPVNSALNYGYAILLSAINREIASLGYSTQLGIFHCNKFNHFNLGSDLMEPLRPLVDRIVLDMDLTSFGADSKRRLAGLLNEEVDIEDRHMHLVNALPIYVKSVTDALENKNADEIKFCEYENACHAADCVLRSSRQNGR